MSRKCLPVALAFAASMAFGTSAQAGPDYYVAAGAGLSLLEPIDVNEPSSGTSFETTPFPGYLLTGAAGLDFGMLRLEGEVLYNRHNLDDLSSAGVSAPAEGDFETLAGMANAYFDFPTGIIGITPFVGAGVGYAQVSANDIRFLGASFVDDKDGGLAYQAKAGIAFTVFPFTKLVLGYRYLVTDDLDMQGASGSGVNIKKLNAHIAELGLRFTL